MKLLLAIFCLLISLDTYAQEFRRTFDFDFRVIKMGDEDSVTAARDTIFKRVNLGKRTKEERFDSGDIWYISPEEGIAFGKHNGVEKAVINDTSIILKAGCRYVIKNILLPQIEEKIGTTTVTHVVMPEYIGTSTKCFIKFEEEKMWVNPYLNSGNQWAGNVVFYKLRNRQTVKPAFSEITVSTLLLPLRYRFGGSRDGNSFSEDFTASVNVNAFIGFTWPFKGVVRYHYRKQVGSVTTTKKFMIGPLIGASTVTLDKSNTSASKNRITTDEKINKGLLTVGGGITYSINKINFGCFTGIDFSVGDDAARWNYNRQWWVGVAVGYSIFPFAQ